MTRRRQAAFAAHELRGRAGCGIAYQSQLWRVLVMPLYFGAFGNRGRCFVSRFPAENCIYLRPNRTALPEHVGRLVQRIKRAHPHTRPPLILSGMSRCWLALPIGAGEPGVEEYWKCVLLFAPSSSDVLAKSTKVTTKHPVPSKYGSGPRVSSPVSDLL